MFQDLIVPYACPFGIVANLLVFDFGLDHGPFRRVWFLRFETDVGNPMLARFVNVAAGWWVPQQGTKNVRREWRVETDFTQSSRGRFIQESSQGHWKTAIVILLNGDAVDKVNSLRHIAGGADVLFFGMSAPADSDGRIHAESPLNPAALPC